MRLFFTLKYFGSPPWDTNVTPPELIKLIEDEGLAAGNALDIGCGTGTNVVYLARHGWQVTGIDYVGRAIRKARRKVGAARMNDRTTLLIGDVTRLEKMALPAVNLALDIGCLHSLDAGQRVAYAHGLGRVAAPGATYLLYAFEPSADRVRPPGISVDEVRSLFEANFELIDVQHTDASDFLPGSAWYRLQRLA